MEDKKKKRSGRNSRFKSLAMLLGAGLMLIFGCKLCAFGLNFVNACLWNDVMAFENISGVALPDSATNLYLQCNDGWFNSSAFAQFDLPPADVPFLLQRLGGEHTLHPSGTPVFIAQNAYAPINKRIEQMQSYLYSLVRDAGKAEEILIDTSDSTQYTVYLYIYHTTYFPLR